jgi:hypothetical protein
MDGDSGAQWAEVPVEERGLVLAILAFLAAQDGRVEPEERKLLSGTAELLSLDPTTGEAFISRGLTAVGLESLAPVIQTPWVGPWLVHALLVLALSDGDYDARERAGVLTVARSLGVPRACVERLEAGIASDAVLAAVPKAEVATSRSSGFYRWAMVGGAVVGGAALLGVTGGLAAPALGGAIGVHLLGLSGAAATSAGLASLGGGALGTGFGMAGGTMAVQGVCGLTGAALAGSAMFRRTAEVREFEPVHLAGESMHAVLAVSGWLTQKQEHQDVWETPLAATWPEATRWALKWESQNLQSLGKVLVSAGVQGAAQTAVASVAKSAVRTAGWLVALPATAAQSFALIDNPWDVARIRAEKSGELLADLLLERGLGRRPVTLVGFSLGARVIAQACASLQERAAPGLVHDVVFLGGAVGVAHPGIRAAVEVAEGRVINAYSSKDAVLAYLYRARQCETAVGLVPVELEGVTDIDVTDVAPGHTKYGDAMEGVLRQVRSALA